LVYLLQIIVLAFKRKSPEALVISVLSIAIGIAMIIYLVRIYNGLIEVFGRNKRWMVAFVLVESLTVMIWGFSSKFVPKKQVFNPKTVDSAKVSDTHLDTIDDGLTVNIKERTAFDFFRKKILLKDIHMTIPKGHMVLLLGGSGAGKTTYLNAVTGYEKADATIELGGQDIYKDYAKMKYDVGFVPQQDLMRGNDTVLMTLFDAASLRLPSNVSFKEKRKRVREVLEEFGLAAISNSLVEKLSGGQRKRLSIAMEFISDPTLFILDEPDSGLDGVVARGLFEKLRAIADQGKIVVVITHTPDRVIDLFDDVIVLAKDAGRTGRLAWYGPIQEAREFFGKDTMEEILLSINQKEEGGEGRADEYVEKYADRLQEAVG
jgi:ABC-type multidrug transport system ATPase subunit